MKGPLSFARTIVHQLPEYYFDFGSTTTRVISGNRLVYCEPTCMVIHRGHNSVVAVGAKAYGLLGKVAPSLEIVFPIAQGTWISVELAQLYCQAIQRSIGIPWTVQSHFFGLVGAMAVSAAPTSLEQRITKQVVQHAGLQRVVPIARSKAIFYRRRTSTSETEVAALLDFGGQQTEASIMAGGAVVYSEVFPWGGVRLTEKTQILVQSLYSCALGWQTAEEVKRQLVRLYSGLAKTQADKWRQTKLAVRGKDVVTQTAKTVIIAASDFEEVGREAFEELSEYVRDFLSAAPTELGTLVLSQGIVLSGGGSKLKGLKEALEKTLQCEMLVVATPELDAVEGLSVARGAQ